MKRCSGNELCDSRKLIKHEPTPEDLMRGDQKTHIISNTQIDDSDILITVRVENDSILFPRISLVTGDRNLYEETEMDILRHLLRQHNRLQYGKEHDVYVSF